MSKLNDAFAQAPKGTALEIQQRMEELQKKMKDPRSAWLNLEPSKRKEAYDLFAYQNFMRDRERRKIRWIVGIAVVGIVLAAIGLLMTGK